jgi:hypothetical protein
MRLYIILVSEDHAQVLIKNNATDADLRVLTEAQHGNPEEVLGVPCQVTPKGPVRERLIRARHIRAVVKEDPDLI